MNRTCLEDDGPEEFSIASGHAYVAASFVSCNRCEARFEAICIYCESGVVLEEPLTRFTVSGLWAMDDGLKRQLAPWPTFRWAADRGCFANHCPRCHGPQDDLDLHSEPDQPFFNIPHAPPGSLELTPLIGPIQLSGSESFEI